MAAGANVASVDRRFLKPGWIAGHLLVVAAFAVCCRLGVWQWDRTHDADGTLQNLSYAVLWPGFGIAFIYMWIRFLMLEKAKDVAESDELDEGLRVLLTGPDSSGSVDSDADPAAPGASEPDAAPPTPNGAEAPSAAEAAHDVDSQDDETFVGTVEFVNDDDDPELAAYNRALAALAERDEPRGR